MPSEMEQQQMNIRLTPELYQKLKEISVREERTISQTVRYALRRYADEA